MDNSEATLQCQNLTCLASNPATHQFCLKCGTPLVRRYLRVIGDGVKTDYQPGELLDERYLIKQSQIVLDTKPALSPQAPEEFPNFILPYLKLFSYKLHIPQIYGYIPPSDDQKDQTMWLLEYGTVPTNATGELKYSELLPSLEQCWPEASEMRQLNWLWQMAKLWQPLVNKEVASSLFNSDLLRVNDRHIQLLELHLDHDVKVNFKPLGKLWSQWVSSASPRIRDFLGQLSQQLETGKITRTEQLISLLDLALFNLGQSQKRTYQIFTVTDTGQTREHNEDACYPVSDRVITFDEQETSLAIVCDGIGGQEGGEIASNLAIETLSRDILNFAQTSSPWNPIQYISSIEKAIAHANDAISGRNDQENRHERQRMGTTLVLGLNHNHEMYIAHVGDSRVYWITPNSCQQITTDDDLASREVRLGYLAYRDAVQYPNAGALVQALGMSGSPSLHPTVQRFILDENCIFLLCSDGLSDYDRVEQFWQSEIVSIINENKDLSEVGKQLIKIANEKNGHDNITIALIYCQVEPKDQDSQTPLSFSELESSISSLSGPTFIEQTENFNLQEEEDADIPTVISSPVTPATPLSSPTPTTSVPPRSRSPFPLLLSLLGVGIAIIGGGYLGQKLLFPNLSVNKSPTTSPTVSPIIPNSSPEVLETLNKGELIEFTTTTTLNISGETSTETPPETSQPISQGSIFQVVEVREDTVLLKDCLSQGVESAVNPSSSPEISVLKTSLKSEEYKTIPPNSPSVQKLKNCQVSNPIDPSESSSPTPEKSPLPTTAPE
ncbi:protein serine/threonine phosphatase [Gloeothece citriformis PCC 7424]|uniref:Protein serine/threonine phosphatase n=1 Tax=Gloeothece citriformis (strain PCC 7424) TaxID=65393 RepID=B7KFF2_GLOC7|nr:protein phosphatase 2C domain-containing protein [Gloeothece citriformis]ACK71868.1 protein serine/threonine phosphatase [Gloeothece citriformis PCC 7424]